MLRALRLHLASALRDDNLMEGVGFALYRFADLSEQSLVRNPRRDRDHPEGVYAQEELGLEYLYGSFHAFDDIQHMPIAERAAAETALKTDLRNDVLELHDHLTSMLEARGSGG